MVLLIFLLSRMLNVVVFLIVFWNVGFVLVMLRCSGQLLCLVSWWYVLIIMMGLLCLMEILKLWKLCFLNSDVFQMVFFMRVFGVVLLYFLSRWWLSEFVFMLMCSEILVFLVVFVIFLIWLLNLWMLLGLICMVVQFVLIVWKMYFGWKWMLVIIGIWFFLVMMCSMLVLFCDGIVMCMILQFDVVSLVICCRVLLILVVFVVVIDCMLMGVLLFMSILFILIC